MSAQLGNAHDEHGDNNPGPCPGCCNIGHCFKEMIACEQFAGFVTRNKRWSSASRFPLRETYVRGTARTMICPPEVRDSLDTPPRWVPNRDARSGFVISLFRLQSKRI